MKGRLLIVNPSGLHHFESLYAALGELGWHTVVEEVQEPALLEWYARLKSFRPSLKRWRNSLDRTANQLCRTSFAFRYKSRLCARRLAKQDGAFDVILQTGGMFAHFWPRPRAPYAIFCDCTVKLGEQEPLSGVMFPSAVTARRWYELERSLYHNAGALFPASERVRRSLIEDYGVEGGRVVVVGEAANLQAPDPLQRRDDGLTILYVGYEFERKGGHVLLEAFRRVVGEMPGARLLIAGPPRLQVPLPAGARLLGPLSRRELQRAYLESTVFAMPSLFEPYGIVFLEAMEHGLPCIGSDRCAMPEIIEHGRTGFVVPAGEPQPLARRILELLRHPELARKMGLRGRERVRRRFTWPAVARRMDERLDLLVAEGRRGAA